MLPLRRVRSRIALLWFVGAGLVYLLLIGQSLGTVYSGRLIEVWGWALPAFMPTLSLIVSVFGASALISPSEDARVQVRGDFYRLTYGLSVTYLCVILMTILAQPIATALNPDENFKAADVLKLSSFWIAPLQSLVVLAMGSLFFAKQTKPG